MDSGGSFEFGAFRFHARGKQLVRNGIVVPVGSRALDILAFLLDHAGQTVGKDALMTAVWPGRVVEESNLTVHMSALRRVLEEGGAGTSFIHTDPGRGYRFAAPVVETPSGETPSPASGNPVAASPRREKPSIAALP